MGKFYSSTAVEKHGTPLAEMDAPMPNATDVRIAICDDGAHRIAGDDVCELYGAYLLGHHYTYQAFAVPADKIGECAQKIVNGSGREPSTYVRSVKADSGRTLGDTSTLCP